jgi:hypothetical protein
MSFFATQLTGFGCRDLVETLVDRTTGTNIGDATAGGGLTAVFDGTTSQTYGASGGRDGPNSTTYAGKDWSALSAKIVSKAITYGSSDHGYAGGGASPTVTLTLYGKNGAPSSGTDGTSLATTNFSDVNNTNSKTLTVVAPSTAYTHAWVYVSYTGSDGVRIAEVEFYEML